MGVCFFFVKIDSCAPAHLKTRSPLPSRLCLLCLARRSLGEGGSLIPSVPFAPSVFSVFSRARTIAGAAKRSKPSAAPIMHHKRLVSWNRCLCDRTKAGVRSSIAAGHDHQSRPLVSLIRALPLALNKTRTVTGATKPAQPKGGAGLASSHLQAGVIYP